MSLFISFGLMAVQDEIPIDGFAMKPVFKNVVVSPDGKSMALLRAAHKGGYYIIEVFKTNALDKDPVRFAANERSEFSSVRWLNNKQLMVRTSQNLQTQNDNYMVSQTAIVNANGKGTFKSLPDPRASVLSTLPLEPNYIMLSYDFEGQTKNSINGQVSGYPDVVKYNIKTGRTKSIFRGSEKYPGGFLVDFNGELRSVSGYDFSSGARTMLVRKKGEEDWIPLKEMSRANRETFSIQGFDAKRPNIVLIRAHNGEDKVGLYEYDLETETMSEALFKLKSVDAGGFVRSRKPNNIGTVLGYNYQTDMSKTYWIDPARKALADGVSAIFPNQTVYINSASHDNKQMVLYVASGQNPGSYYLLSNFKDLKFIGATYPLLTQDNLAEADYVKYKARDGRKIYAYTTVPKGKGPFPTIVMPHGGPWVRDVGLYDEWSQVLASRGYAVIRPNYRGSTGYGLDHWKAGDAKWGYEMQDDLDDAAAYMVDKKIADPDRLAIFGWSYGGYAAFAAATREVESPYKCAIAGAGVANLDLIRASTGRSAGLRAYQRPTIKGLNPIDHVDRVKMPMLIIHGDQDERVDIKHSDAFVGKLKSRDKDFKYIVLKGANHFSSTLTYDHKIKFYTEMLDYLKTKCFPQ